jgi:hypothetical protein
MKNPNAPAVKREAEEDWGRGRWRLLVRLKMHFRTTLGEGDK